MSSPQEESKSLSEPQPIPQPTVVGIGASAGGLAALITFFENVPADSGLSFVVVVHLSPEHKSHFAALLQPHVRFPIEQLSGTTLLEPNHAYLIPPAANVSAIDTHLRLSELEENRALRAPIDYFLRTLAASHDGHSIAVILTGTGSDGTLGIKQIKAAGGTVIVQDPNEAEYDGMPQSAIATGLADFVAPVAQIPEILLRLEGTRPRLTIAPEEDETPDEHQLLQEVFAQIRDRTGRDFSHYKRATIMRRIARRMQLRSIEHFPAYVEALHMQPEEVTALADDLLVIVTNFFRDPEVFEKLAKDIVPRLFEDKSPGSFVRAWLVGCATGEEPYSIAMLLEEEASRREAPPHIQIFASDLHGPSLEKARQGFYAGEFEADVNPERLKKFFAKEKDGFRIRKEIRDLVVFAHHNLLADPPFSRMDLICCRNLLIYLERDVQRDVIELFHYALKPEGILVLGTAEGIDAGDLFTTEDKSLRIFRKRNVAGPQPHLPVFPLTRMRAWGEKHPAEPAPPPAVSSGGLHQRLMDLYAPPSVLVSPENNLVHLSAHAGRYILHPGGEPVSNIFKLVREELAGELRALLEFAHSKGKPCDSAPIPVRFNGSARPVTMHVRPAPGADHKGFALVIFEEREAESTAAATAQEAPTEAALASRVRNLESEASEYRERMSALIEEFQSAQEEMKAANEEAQSTNEELRSTMEELETSKEELESINQELQTVNQESRHKMEEFSQLTSDLNNVLSGTGVAALFLDRKLRILRFTPKVSEVFNVRTTDCGRPISDLTQRLGYSDLLGDAQAVLKDLTPIERELQNEDGCWFSTRVLPYRSADDRIEGVVLTFVDITRRVIAETALRDANKPGPDGHK